MTRLEWFDPSASAEVNRDPEVYRKELVPQALDHLRAIFRVHPSIKKVHLNGTADAGNIRALCEAKSIVDFQEALERVFKTHTLHILQTAQEGIDGLPVEEDSQVSYTSSLALFTGIHSGAETLSETYENQPETLLQMKDIQTTAKLILGQMIEDFAPVSAGAGRQKPVLI